jgi:hypothetical protein
VRKKSAGRRLGVDWKAAEPIAWKKLSRGLLNFLFESGCIRDSERFTENLDTQTERSGSNL